jgi:hypothetical protein
MLVLYGYGGLKSRPQKHAIVTPVGVMAMAVTTHFPIRVFRTPLYYRQL